MSEVRNARPIKEAFFVQVKTPDGSLVFFDETKSLGRPMPYNRPEATCALRVTPHLVIFSVLKHTKRSRAQAAEQRLELPRGPLDRSQRRSPGLLEGLQPGEVAVEMDDQVFKLTAELSDNGSLTLDAPADQDEHIFTLPPGRVRILIAMRLSEEERPIVVAFQGHVGKPEDQETLTRVVAIALQLLTGMAAFSLVTNIKMVQIPAAPSRYLAQRPVIRPSERARKSIKVHLWDENNRLESGTEGVEVEVELDLESANPVSGRFMFHLRVDDEHKEIFKKYYNSMNDAALNAVNAYLDADEAKELIYSITLGELTDGDKERLRDAVNTVRDVNLNPLQWQWVG